MAGDESKLFDLLLPIEMPAEAGFTGRSGRGPHAFNGEAAFAFGVYEASFHACGGKRYFLIRLTKPRSSIEAELPELRRRLARASVMLDVSIRANDGELLELVSGERADLDFAYAFPAGEMPHVMAGDDSVTFRMDVAVLSDALAHAPWSRDIERAARIFVDIDFEASDESRYVLLSTILELLADRRDRDGDALGRITGWTDEAAKAGRQDLAEALKLMRAESIGTAICRLVVESAQRAGCSDEESEALRKQARDAYRGRSALLHGGTPITPDQLARLRGIVRLVLTGNRSPTFFTQVGNRQWVERAIRRAPLVVTSRERR